MNCIRPSVVQQGSRVASPLPAATPLHPRKLGKGAIAGIVVGSVIFVGAVIWLCVWLYLRIMKKQRARREGAAAPKEIELEKKKKEEEIKREGLQPLADSS